MQQSNRRPPPAPLNLQKGAGGFASLTWHSRSPRPPQTAPPRTPLPSLPSLSSLPLPTPPHTPRSPRPQRGSDRCPSRSSCASPLSSGSCTFLDPYYSREVRDVRDPGDRRSISRRLSETQRSRGARESLVPLPTKFHEDEDGAYLSPHPFARVEDADTLYSPTLSSYSGTTAVSGAGRTAVDARIADLEAQLRALQERLEPDLRPSKSMPLLGRLRRKEDRGTKEFKALVDAKRGGRGVRDKDKDKDKDTVANVIGSAGKSVIDLSHLSTKEKEKRRWRLWGPGVKA